MCDLEIKLEIPERSKRIYYYEIMHDAEGPLDMESTVNSEYFDLNDFLESLSNMGFDHNPLYSEPRNGSKKINKVHMFLYLLHGITHIVKNNGKIDEKESFEPPTFVTEPTIRPRKIANFAGEEDIVDIFRNHIDCISAGMYSANVVMNAWWRLDTGIHIDCIKDDIKRGGRYEDMEIEHLLR